MGQIPRRPRRTILKHWYYIIHEQCPVCGREEVTRERKLTPRPEKHEDRNEYKYLNCYCYY